MDPAWLPEAPDLLRYGVVALLAAAVIWYWQRSDFVIRVRHRHVECWGRIPSARQPEMAEFLLRDLNLSGPARIAGRWQGGRLVLSCRGLDRGQQQRVRNFLLTRLRGRQP